MQKNDCLFKFLKIFLENKNEQICLKLLENHLTDFPKFMILKYLSMHKNKEVRDFILSRYLLLERANPKAFCLALCRGLPRTTSYIQYLR